MVERPQRVVERCFFVLVAVGVVACLLPPNGLLKWQLFPDADRMIYADDARVEW